MLSKWECILYWGGAQAEKIQLFNYCLHHFLVNWNLEFLIAVLCIKEWFSGFDLRTFVKFCKILNKDFLQKLEFNFLCPIKLGTKFKSHWFWTQAHLSFCIQSLVNSSPYLWLRCKFSLNFFLVLSAYCSLLVMRYNLNNERSQHFDLEFWLNIIHCSW